MCFGAYNGLFYGASAASGRVLWRVSTGGAISGAAVIVDGVAYVGSFAGRIIGVNLHTGPASHDVPTRRVRARLGERGPPALQRVLAHLRRGAAPLEAAAARALTAS